MLSYVWFNKVPPDGSARVLLLWVPHPTPPSVEVSVRGTHVLRPGLSSPRLAEPQAGLPLSRLEPHHPTRACGAPTGRGSVGERIPARLQVALVAAGKAVSPGNVAAVPCFPPATNVRRGVWATNVRHGVWATNARRGVSQVSHVMPRLSPFGSESSCRSCHLTVMLS